MKKLLMFFALIAIVSCNDEEQVTQSLDAKISNDSVLEGGILSFKDEEFFAKEYAELAKLNSKELQNWISRKEIKALLNTSSDSLTIQEDKISDSRIVYSDVLKSLLNSESKIKIGSKILWLNERIFYLLPESELSKTSDELIRIKDKLKVYGQLLSLSGSTKSLTSRNVIPNENTTKTFVSPEQTISGSRLRHVVDIFNETIVLNDNIQTSKMYIRSTLQYRSCSTFRCTWKEASNVRTITSDFYCAACGNGFVAPWALLPNINSSNGTGTQTYQIADWAFKAPLANSYTNFAVSGKLSCQIAGGSFVIDISWY